MDADDIKSMFNGVSEFTKDIVARKLKGELAAAIIKVNAALNGKTRDCISPDPSLIMNAFRYCDLASCRVVLLGQDPYINPGEAMGMSFSVPKGKTIPPSLRKIYECLLGFGLIKKVPTHGDLTVWAQQGVLLINAALTTEMRRSNAHAEFWAPYTDALIREISALPQTLIFILLGGPAQKKKSLIDTRRHVILEWGHPSTLNSANRTDGPKNFKYCNVFERVNDMLIMRNDVPINWDPDYVMPAPRADAPVESAENKDSVSVSEVSGTDETNQHGKYGKYGKYGKIWLFTDGGSKSNGRKDCDASWAFYVVDDQTTSSNFGIVDKKDIPGEEYKSSNNRGELTAILNGLQFLANEFEKRPRPDMEIIVVSDSEYSINCITKWADKWIADPVKHKLSEKKNLDIIIPAKDIVDKLRRDYSVEFRHVRSHLDAPADAASEEWFIWKCNDIVDGLCNKALGRL